MSSNAVALATLIEDLVAANRVLAEHGVIDGYGHVSVRSPERSDRYYLARSLAPELVTADDIMEFDLDSNPIDQRGRDMYTERYIHGEAFRARPEVNAVVHNHSPSIIPFGNTGVPLRPMYHMSAFVGAGVPVFEIRDTAGDSTDLLIRDRPLGLALAKCLDCKPAALMRGHGAVVVAESIPVVVGRSIYLEMNARLQMQALMIAGSNGNASGNASVTYLSPGEVEASFKVQNYLRAWDLWRRKALATVSR